MIILLVILFLSFLFVIYYHTYRIPTVGLLYNEPYKPNTHPIDVVYTWVDSSDKNWQKQRDYYSKKIDKGRFPDPENPDLELETSLLLLFKFAPFINNVYIVTADGQIPKCIHTNSQLANKPIKIVHHSQIWHKNMLHTLPVFCSKAIEANLHRIPGLSELFMYFNDDMYLVKNLDIYDCFINNYSIVQPMEKYKPPRPPGDKWANSWKYTMKNYYPMNIPYHGFICLNKSSMEKAEKNNTDWSRTIKSKFRQDKDLPPIGYTVNYALKNRLSYLTNSSPLNLIYIGDKKEYKYSDRDDWDIICINYTNDSIRDSKEVRKYLYI